MTPSRIITFRVFGLPQTKGSTKAFMRPGMKYPVVTNDNTKNKAWASVVRLCAQQQAPQAGPWEGPVYLELSFSLVRPKSLSKKVFYPIKRPDLDKITRSIKDALTGVLYRDDSQVVDMKCSKRYELPCFPPGVLVLLTDLRNEEGDE